MEGINKTSHKTMEDLFSTFDPVKISSHPGIRRDLFKRRAEETLITDFFGGVARAEVVDPILEDDELNFVDVSNQSRQEPLTAKASDFVVLGAQAHTVPPKLRAWGSLAAVGLVSILIVVRERSKRQ